MVIIEDKGQHDKKHIAKHFYFESHGIYWERYPLPVGDYILVNDKVFDLLVRKQKRSIDVKKMDFLGTYDVTVDTKKDIQEIIGNVCGKEHARFRDECIVAQNNGIKLYVLIENADRVQSIDDLVDWDNPRSKLQRWITTPSGERRKVLKYPDATKGGTLAKAMRTMQERYGVIFMFTTPEESGKQIISLLSKEAGGIGIGGQTKQS